MKLFIPKYLLPVFFILLFSNISFAQIPVITADLSIFGSTVNTSLGYSFGATNNPTGYGVIGTLPLGLNLDIAPFEGSIIGQITGTPSQIGIFYDTLTASNISGTAYFPIVINIIPKSPSITSGAHYNQLL
jgi:hypothetical protein